MTIDFGSWLGVGGDMSAVPSQTEAERSVRAWRRINDKPSTVAFRKPDGTTLAAQTVRLESANSVGRTQMADSAAGIAPIRSVVIFGVRNHATVADTDIGEGYRFVQGNDQYTIVDIIETLGEVQGVAEAIG